MTAVKYSVSHDIKITPPTKRRPLTWWISLSHSHSQSVKLSTGQKRKHRAQTTKNNDWQGCKVKQKKLIKTWRTRKLYWVGRLRKEYSHYGGGCLTRQEKLTGRQSRHLQPSSCLTSINYGCPIRLSLIVASLDKKNYRRLITSSLTVASRYKNKLWMSNHVIFKYLSQKLNYLIYVS